MIEIRLPKRLGDERLDTVLLLFDQIQKHPKVTINFSKVDEILPAGHMILISLIDKIVESNCDVTVVSISNKIGHLKSVQLLRRKSNEKILSNPVDLSFMEKNLIIRLGQNSIMPNFLDDVDSVFNDILKEDLRWYIRLIINELMQNACDHSTAERYCIYAGLYKNHIHFGVGDLGVTIPAKLEQKYNCIDDASYLLKSLEENVGTRRTRTGGLGLTHMFETLKKQEGRLVLLSRAGGLRKYFIRRRTIAYTLKNPLRGTWCFSRIPLLK